MKVAVVGCGYVGLVTAVGLARAGHEVVGIETDPTRIYALQRHVPPFHEPGIAELLPRLALPQRERFDFLEELPLTPQEKQILREIREISQEINPAQQVAHLPYFLIIADHP